MAPHAHMLRRCTYCKYGKEIRKATHIWTNVVLPRPLRYCDSQDPCEDKRAYGRHLRAAQHGPTSNNTPGSGPAVNLYPLPSQLVKELFEAATRGLGRTAVTALLLIASISGH